MNSNNTSTNQDFVDEMQAQQQQNELDLSVVYENDDEDMDNSFMMANQERKALAQRETKVVSCLRLFVLGLLVTVALLVSIFCFVYTRGGEQEEFENAVEDHANKILTGFVRNAQQRTQLIEGLSQEITSHALFANSTFPNVVLPDFERRGTHITELADVTYVQLAMIVTDENRHQWENFTVDNQDWLVEGLAQQEALTGDRLEQQQENLANLQANEDLLIPPSIYKVEGLGPAPELGPGPYLAYWQMAPAIPVAALVNFNVFSHPGLRQGALATIEAKRPVVSTGLDLSNTSNPSVAGMKWVIDLYVDRSSQGTEHYRNDIHTRMMVPIFDNFLPHKKLVGLVFAGIYWRSYLTNILPESAKGIHVVMENTCDQMFTYVLNGAECDYLGPGDLHDPTFDQYEYSTAGNPGALIGGDGQAEDTEQLEGECRYGIRVYPSEETQQQHLTNQPLAFTLSLVAVFVFTSLVFVTYDCIVERRQRLVLRAAIQSGTIVSSLFPKEVRDKLYADNQQKLVEEEGKGGAFKRQETAPQHDGPSSLAQMYPDCTVFFADLVGFTSWSSSRSPEQVFQLLETIYGSFDRIAKKMRVYKIETIGDCYVAVTGLPQAQPDHASRMVRFAADCLLQMNEQLQVLAPTLGQDTSSLAMRVGLNSGPVTAGVLRGDRARFQLFGDTVNTAARMESNGLKGRIQVSPSTAQLLMDAGKERWLTKREDLVEAKGKGSIQTYFALPDCHRMTESVASYSSMREDGVLATTEQQLGNGSGNNQYSRTMAC